jgi:hypothetical protein
MPTIAAPDPCKSIMRVSTIKVAINNLSDIRSEKAILPLKAFLVDLFKCLEMIFNTAIIC